MVISAGSFFSQVLASSITHNHDNISSKIVFSKLDIKSSDRLSNQPQHYCPVHDQILDGAYCKLGFAPFNDPESSSRQKEYFIATECGGHPYGSGTAVLQIDHKFSAVVMSDNKMTLPSFVFSYFELIDYSQGYFNSPDKPPKLFS